MPALCPPSHLTLGVPDARCCGQVAEAAVRSANEAVAEVRRAADTSLAKQGSRWNESCRQAQGVTVKASTVVATATTRVMALEHQIEMLMAESRANSSGRGKTVVEAAVKSLELVRMMAG